MPRTRWLLILILAAFMFSLYFGVAGVDYGTQWDQNNIKGFVNKFIRTGNILTGEYHYPPVSAYIASTTTIPYALPSLIRYGTNWFPTQSYLLDEVLKNPNQAFLLNLRRVFVAFTVLAVVWTGLAAAQRSALSGVIAAGLMAFSWEISYHSRVVHPDGPTMQFAALSLLLGMLAFSRVKPVKPIVWLHLAAAASAVATATKYTAGISLLAVLIFAIAILRAEKLTWPRLFWSLVGLGLTYAAVFLVLVPGALLERGIFFEQLSRDQSIYASGHGRQTVEAGLGYLVRVLAYVFGVAFTVHPLLAVVPTVLILAGVYSLLATNESKDKWLLAALLSGPILYILFLSANRVLFVRNLLQTLPAFAVLAGFGFVWICTQLKDARPVVRLAPFVPVLLLFGLNAYWIGYSAWTIQMRHTDLYKDQAIAEIEQHPDQTVYITSAARILLDERQLPANATTSKSEHADLVLFAYLADTFDEDEGNWPVNSIGVAPQIIGPQDINMDWYASWPASERFVLAPPGLAWEEGGPFVTKFTPGPQEVQTAVGTLDLDGQQFSLVLADGSEIFAMNSANPQLVLALNDRLGQALQVAGYRFSEERPNDWFWLGLADSPVLAPERLRVEYNFARFDLGLTPQQRACSQDAIGSVMWDAMGDHAFGFTQLSNDRLRAAAACLN